MDVNEAYKNDPILEEVKFKYRPGGGEENFVIVNGVNIGDIVTGVSLDCMTSDAPRIVLHLEPLCCDIDADGSVEFDIKDLTDSNALKLYDALKKRFKDS